MKIKVTDLSYEELCKLQPYPAKQPKKQGAFWRWLLKTVSAGELKKAGFSYTLQDMDRIGPNEPCLFLMNHSSFIDLEIAATLLADRQYHIICTDDGLVGKEGLMRTIGCIPTRKFISDLGLVRNMKYAVSELQSSILMYPEASYSFDGTATPLPQSLGKLIKMLKVPVVMIRTEGAFLYDPLYNCLQKRKVPVSAHMKCLLTAQEAEALSVAQINDLLKTEFTFDHFRAQDEAGLVVNEPFRADGLERALYQCPRCSKEHVMVGKGTSIRCTECGAEYTLGETGRLQASEGETEFAYVSDWYRWERSNVRAEIEAGTYRLEADVSILALVDLKSIYRIGTGHLVHTDDGFHLTGCDGKLDFSMTPAESYSLYSDYYWYELGDMICIGNSRIRYYCFPTPESSVDVAKARLAAEELFKARRP